MSEIDTSQEIADLRALVNDLSSRIEYLESKLDEQGKEISEETLIAISAAVAAYLGHRAKIRQVRFASPQGTTWATQGRTEIQHSHSIHPVH